MEIDQYPHLGARRTEIFYCIDLSQTINNVTTRGDAYLRKGLRMSMVGELLDLLLISEQVKNEQGRETNYTLDLLLSSCCCDVEITPAVF